MVRVKPVCTATMEYMKEMLESSMEYMKKLASQHTTQLAELTENITATAEINKMLKKVSIGKMMSTKRTVKQGTMAHQPVIRKPMSLIWQRLFPRLAAEVTNGQESRITQL